MRSIICGLNGAGKSTFGKALAERLGYRFVDVEDLYFSKTDPDYLYASPRTEEEVGKLNVPKNIRMQRVKNRSFEKFGERALPGGDLYEKEQSFYELIQSRRETLVSEWVEAAKIPFIHLNGEKAINENIDLLLEQMQ